MHLPNEWRTHPGLQKPRLWQRLEGIVECNDARTSPALKAPCSKCGEHGEHLQTILCFDMRYILLLSLGLWDRTKSCENTMCLRSLACCLRVSNAKVRSWTCSHSWLKASQILWGGSSNCFIRLAHCSWNLSRHCEGRGSTGVYESEGANDSATVTRQETRFLLAQIGCGEKDDQETCPCSSRPLQELVQFVPEKSEKYG